MNVEIEKADHPFLTKPRKLGKVGPTRGYAPHRGC